MIHSITAKAIRLLPVMYPILLLLLSVHAPLASCIDQQKQEATNNISIPQPRYFSKLPQERINLEVEYAQTHRKWSQRVVLEIFHSQMIGRSAVFNGNASMEGADIGTFRHPETGEFEKFRKGQQPNWDHFNYEGMDTICNHWEGITCHEREDNGIGDICWCIMEWEANEYKWADDSDNVPADCQRKCQGHDMIGKNQAPLDAITRINLNNYGLVGSMIPEELSHLKFLERIELGGNRLIGAFPRTLGDLPGLKHVNLSNCDVLEFSKDLKPMLWLDELILRDSYLSGTIPQGLFHSTKLILLDLGKNELNGSIPSEFFHLTKLVKVLLDDNMLTGTIPTEIGRLASLKYFSMEYNELTGSIPHEMATLPHLEFLKLNHNDLTGKIPPELFTDSFLALEVYNNQLTGSIPKEMQASTSLQFVNLARNKLKGKIEPEFCERIRPVSKFSNDDVSPCDHLIVCPRGYFHYLGLATLTEGCASCPSCHSGDLKDKSCSYVGQTTCNDGTTIVRGDMDGDGALSEREILRLIYMLNEGHDWEDEFSVWGDMTHGDACDLPGVDCKSGLMGISLKKANMCSSRNKSCGVLPLEIGLLQKSLEVLDVGRTSENKTRMRIPSEIGQLTKLKVLDVSNNLIGALPSEIGQCQELLLLNLFRTGLTGTLEENVWSLKKLQKLDIRENKFSSQNISQIMQLANLQEILASRSSLVGTIPSEIGALKGLMNIELWGNALVGSIPQSVEKLQFLTRIE
jgi:Leucine-rich repeat (LRR) protein